ncbi:hypothetical protein AOB58_1906 [Staphylococcus sp. AntiMn-1]|nr:hypothetical protein AOB58_1906 [Staphylococcus sp. AntiMn-1]
MPKYIFLGIISKNSTPVHPIPIIDTVIKENAMGILIIISTNNNIIRNNIMIYHPASK